MDYQNYLYLEYRRTLRKFRKLQTRFEKRIAKDTFQSLTARRRYKILSQLRKLKQKIEQLAGRLKLAAAGGSLAFSMAMGLGSQEAQAQGVPGTPKYLNIDKTRANDITTGTQQDPDVAYNNEDNFVVVWEDSNDVYGKAYGGSADASVNFNIIGGEDHYLQNPAVALNDEDEFVVAWQETYSSNYSIKYTRYQVDDGVISEDGPYTVASGVNVMGDVDVALDESGGLVIVWEEDNGGNDEINARYYTSDNSSNGEISVSQTTSHDQKFPSVDLNNDGEFIVVWKGAQGTTSNFSVLNARKYNYDTPKDDESIIVSATDYGLADKIKSPDVDLNGDGGFVVSWEYEQSAGAQEYVRAQVFDADGAAFSPLINVASSSFYHMSNPEIAADKDGGFVVVFDSEDAYSDQNYIMGSRYNRFGSLIEFWNFYSESYTANNTSNPAIGMNDRGDFVVAWDDNLSAVNAGECNTETDCSGYGVYFKRYQDGKNQPYEALPSEMVNTYSVSDQQLPQIANDSEGNYVVVWEGYWNGSYESGRGIIGQRFDADGEEIGNEFQINTITTGTQSQADVAMNVDGEFIVTWRGYAANSVNGIFAQMYNADGSKNASEIRVDDETSGFYNHYEPSVDIDENGDAIIIYVEDYYDHVKARRINANGTTGGNEFKIDAYTFSGTRNSPDVALNNDGSFVSTFGLKSGGEEHTYYRRFDANDSPLDPTDQQVSSGTSNFTRRQSIALDKTTGDFTIVYNEYDGGNYNIYASKYSSNGTPEFEEKEITSTASNHVPEIDINGNGESVITWEENSGGNSSFVSMLDEEGDFVFEGYSPFEDSYGSPAASLSDDGKVTVVADDVIFDTSSSEVFATTFVKPLEVNTDAGNEFIVNSITTNTQDSPDIAQNESGDFVVVWRDYSTASYPVVRAQRYNDEGIRQGTEFQVNNTSTSSLEDPHVALKDDGTFMVVWTEYSVVGGESDDILGKVYDWEGNTLKNDFIINEETSNNQQSPDIAVNHEGNFQVIWTSRNSSGDTWDRIYGQEVSPSGVPDANGNQNLFEINEISNVTLQASIAINNDGDIAIPYTYQYDGTNSGFYVFDASFEPLVSNLAFSESSYVDAYPPGIAPSQDGDFVIAWSEYALGEEAYYLMARKYSSGSSFEADAVNIGELESEVNPHIASVDDGDFIISYTQYDIDADLYSVYSRRISSEMDPIGPEMKINDISASGSTNNAIASSPDGNYTIAWQSGYADNNGPAIMARQFVSHKPTVGAAGLTLDEGAESTLTSEYLDIQNPAGAEEAMVLTIETLPSEGALSLSGGGISIGQSITGEDLLVISYMHDGDESTSDQFTFSVANEDFETGVNTFYISVNPVNDVPTLVNAIPDQNTTGFESFSYTVPANTFTDVESTTLTLSATLANNSALPGWLSFNAATRTFSGTAPNDPDFDTSIDVKVSASDGEDSASDEFKITIASVLAVEGGTSNGVQLYPNPTDGILHLRPSEHMTGALNMYLFNTSGQLMQQSSIVQTHSSMVINIDVGNLKRGLYLLKLVNENTTSTYKINKE